MKQRAGSVTRLAMPVRALTQRFAFVFLVLAAVGLMLLGRSETGLVERVRAGVVDVVTPIMDALSRPAATVADGIESVRQMVQLYSENKRLTEQNERLLEWQAVARHLAAENRAFREALNYVPDPSARYVTARVIGDAGGVFVQSKLVNAGARSGVAKGSAVTTGAGLAGRVATVGDQSSRVLMITDLNSRIPVVIESSRERAILAGDNRKQPRLEFLRPTATVKPGDRIVTSGHGGLFPPGLPVGTVSTVVKRDFRVQPFVDLDRLEYVRIVDFRAAGLTSLAEPSW